MDLNAVKFSNSSGGLPNNVQRYYINNRLYIIYSKPNY